MAKRWLSPCILLVIFTLAASATAQQPAVAAFPKSTLTLEAYGAYASSLDDSNANLGSANAGFGYFIFDNVSLGAEINGYREQVSGRDAWGYGISGVLRHHLLQFDRTTVFVDVSFGPIESSRRIPDGGTYFDFATRTGIGMTYKLRDNMYLMSGIRYFHLSNARFDGPKRNPSINGIEGVLGLMWTL